MRQHRAIIALSIVLTLGVAGKTLAQEGLLALALCRKIADDQARLKCYDAVFAEPQENAKDDMPKPGAWHIKDEKSPIDDSPGVTAILKAVTGEAFLVARCREKKTELFFQPSLFFIGSTSGGVKMVLRINDAPAVTETWSSSNNGQAAFSHSAIQTLKLLPDSGRLFVRAFNFQGSRAGANWTQFGPTEQLSCRT